jgi:hypothetical protein
LYQGLGDILCRATVSELESRLPSRSLALFLLGVVLEHDLNPKSDFPSLLRQRLAALGIWLVPSSGSPEARPPVALVRDATVLPFRRRRA